MGMFATAVAICPIAGHLEPWRRAGGMINERSNAASASPLPATTDRLGHARWRPDWHGPRARLRRDD